ncbi:strawberry notch-like NTP hydrolase domain-containing protein [Bradyrhizobium sp. CCGUVB4N]|uniref:strawberry notch-like NTP hydrolase domain-containing protein n=1 Tax=Bradyrhizobium sp. CCGUVB4N TaxID=2949631 RepID=UPI0021153B40|nr:strawberry notch family protein [Bradyrhizobium sp. CCGUVB4N]
MTESLAGGAVAAPLSMRAAANIISAVARAARQLLTDLERNRRIDGGVLRSAMKAVFGASDADGAWDWKTACDTYEAATVLFVRRFGPVRRSKPGSTVVMLPLLARIANCLQTHTLRSEDCQALQQFSTPIPLGLAACTAGGIAPADRVLKPVARTGLLATFAGDQKIFLAWSGMAGDVGTLLVTQHVLPKLPVATPLVVDAIGRPAMSRSVGAFAPRPSSTSGGGTPEGVEPSYETTELPPESARPSEAFYEEYELQPIRIPGSCAHPIKLLQSAAVASVALPKPNDRSHLPSSLMADGILLDVRLGAGKGQVAGILLDNWLKGRRRAVWSSKSDELIEDAQRDWSALGMARLLVRPLSRFHQDTPIRLSEGVRFTTYATLPSNERDEMLSRVTQIVEWLGSDFDRMIVFEESHAKTVFELAEDLQFRRVRVMGVNRTEVSGFKGTMGDRPKSYGLFREIISWKLRRFALADATRPGIRAQMLERYPLGLVAEREAA